MTPRTTHTTWRVTVTYFWHRRGLLLTRAVKLCCCIVGSQPCDVATTWQYPPIVSFDAMSNAKERVFHAANLDAVNAAHPHMDDPRFISLTNQSNNCILRFTVFARCARELGEEDTRWATSPPTCSHGLSFCGWQVQVSVLPSPVRLP